MPLSCAATTFTGSNQTGTSNFFGVTTSARYQQITGAFLKDAGLWRSLSSVRLHDSPSAACTLMLFKSPDPSLPLPDYLGEFVQITNAKDSGGDVDENLSSHGFNNQATSGLLVARDRATEFAVSFRSLFLEEWKTTIDDNLGDDAERNGDPTLTWTMFPQGVSHLDPSRRYLKISQKLKIVFSAWPDYDARISYHIRLFLNGDGLIRGRVARWSYWVEGGIKSSGIAEQLEPKVKDGMETLDAKMDELLGAITIPFAGLYFLPGDQTSSAVTPGSGVITGSTLDDVTIVLQL